MNLPSPNSTPRRGFHCDGSEPLNRYLCLQGQIQFIDDFALGY